MWFPISDAEYAMVLEDDNVVAPGFYQFAKRALQHFQFTPEQYDARVFAINLQRQVRAPGARSCRCAPSVH